MSDQNQPPIQPWDAHTQKLVSNVHPADGKDPTPAPRYNLVVIGGGTAGLVSAIGAAGLGAKVALIEKHFMGGDCLNVGCVPSKAIIRAARAVAAVREAAEFGVNVGQTLLLFVTGMVIAVRGRGNGGGSASGLDFES